VGDVFDLDAVAKEASGEPFTFTLGGEQFELPVLTGLDRREFARFLGAIKGEDIDGALALLLGGQGWARFDALPITMEQVNKLLEAYLAHQGLTPGESSASTGS
jgi:hypothetical protein